MKRECGNCTKCCEGFLSGEAKGKTFYNGKPCHFVAIGKGCSIYKERPINPCMSYKCSWLIDENLPEWFKPNVINAIIDVRKINDIEFVNVVEAGERLRADVLSWLITYCLNNGLNFHWTINNGSNWIGSQDFIDAMNEKVNKSKEK